MNTPDITAAQVVALVAATMNLAVQFGVDIDEGQQTALLAFMGVLASIVLADAHVRGKRADNIIAIRRTRIAEHANRASQGERD